MIRAARKDMQTVTRRGDLLGTDRISGVIIADLRPVPTRGGANIETFRVDGPFTGFEVRQANYCPLRAHFTSDWHMHRVQNDVVIPVAGEIVVGLHDDREDSPSYGTSVAVRFSPGRMGALYIPCGVWHALKNAGTQDGAYIVLIDQMYIHADPDDWRLQSAEPVLDGIL